MDTKNKELPIYPEWVCESCGEKYGRYPCEMICWDIGVCEICGTFTSVTKPQDFGYLRNGWQKERMNHEGTN